MGIVSRLGYWEFIAGVTRSINVSFLRGIPIGTTVYIRSRVVQHGKILALIKGEITNEDGSLVYATAEHHKVNIPMLQEHKAERVPYDDVGEQEAAELRKPKTDAKL